MAKKPTKAAEPLGLVGRAFEVVVNNQVERRGVVRGQLTEQHFLVQYRQEDWVTVKHMRIVDIAEMAQPSWLFFEDAAQAVELAS